MKILTDEMYSTRVSINDKIKVDDMNKDAKDFYFSIYSLYMDLLYKFLMKRLDLSNYDDKLRTANFETVGEQDMDFYQSFSSGFLKYFYIRNNLYIERLTNEQISFLGNKVIKQDFSLNQEAEKLIEETYRKVMFENVSGDFSANFVTNFGPNSPKFYAPVDSLVIGVRYQDDLIDGKDSSSLRKLIENRNFVEQLCMEMSKKYTEILSIPVSAIAYDESSVKKKTNIDDSYKK